VNQRPKLLAPMPSQPSEARMFVGPFEHPCLLELFANARGDYTAEALLAPIDEEIERVKTNLIPQEEIERTIARFELYLLGGLETADAHANTIGFYHTVLGNPSAAFDRLEAARALTPNALQRVARKYLHAGNRSVVLVRRTAEADSCADRRCSSRAIQRCLWCMSEFRDSAARSRTPLAKKGAHACSLD